MLDTAPAPETTTPTTSTTMVARRCANCVQPLPHTGTSWKESGACRRNEAGHAALTEDTSVTDQCAVTR